MADLIKLLRGNKWMHRMRLYQKMCLHSLLNLQSWMLRASAGRDETGLVIRKGLKRQSHWCCLNNGGNEVQERAVPHIAFFLIYVHRFAQDMYSFYVFIGYAKTALLPWQWDKTWASGFKSCSGAHYRVEAQGWFFWWQKKSDFISVRFKQFSSFRYEESDLIMQWKIKQIYICQQQHFAGDLLRFIGLFCFKMCQVEVHVEVCQCDRGRWQ